LHLIDFGCQFGVLGAIRGEELDPLPAGFSSSLADSLLEMPVYAIRDKKLGVFRPTIKALREPLFFFA
jgi:hypothetical protein